MGSDVNLIKLNNIPNSELISEIEMALEKAKSGKMKSMILFAELEGGDIYQWWNFKHNNVSTFSRLIGYLEIFKSNLISERMKDPETTEWA